MKEKKLKINVFLNVFKTIMNMCFPLITFPYVSRIIKAENYGKINFASSIISYFLLIAALGISTYAIREGGKIRNDKEKFNKFACEVFTINIIFTIISYALLLILYILWSKLHLYTHLLLIQSLTIIFTTLGVEWIYSIYEDYLYITIRSILFQVLSIVLMFIFVKDINDYIIYASIMVLANVGSNIFNFIHSRKYCNIHLTKQINYKKHIIPMLILFFSNVTITIYANSDITILNIFKNDFAVGIYSVSVKIYAILKQLVSAVFIVIMPRLSFYIANYKEKYTLLLKKLNTWIFVLSIPIIIGTFVLSSEIIILLSGKEYILASSTLRILSISLIFSALATMYGNGILLLERREKTILISTLSSAIINIILNIILIPFMSYNAAAFTTLISEFIVFLLNYKFTKKYFKNIKLSLETNTIIRIIIGSFLIIVICLIFKFIMNNSILIILFSVLLSSLTYFFVILINNKKLINSLKEIKNDKKFI